MSDPLQLIDIGVNLTNKGLFNQLNAVVENAKSAGVIHQIITGTSLEESVLALELAKTNRLYFSSTVGCHPHDAKDFKQSDIKIMQQLAQDESVVAIGECGLDFNRNYSPQDIQEEVFETHVKLACELQLPLFMHQRDAHSRFAEILSRYQGQYKSGVIHCFTGDKSQLRACLDLGLYIGITGWICDERRGHELQEAVKYLPLDRLLIETDSPYLLPRTIQPKPKGRTNTPQNLVWIVKQLASILGLPEATIASESTKNARNLFALTI